MQHLSLCLRHPSLSLLQEPTRSCLPGVLRVALEQGNRGDHCVPHEYFFSQKEKEGKETKVIIKVDVDCREIKNIQLGQRTPTIQSERKYIKFLIVDVANKGLTNQGVSLDLVGACDAADIVRLETLTLVAGHRFAEANVVRDRRANISQSYGGKWKELDLKAWEAGTIIGMPRKVQVAQRCSLNLRLG
jgi:hypothetical protein